MVYYDFSSKENFLVESDVQLASKQSIFFELKFYVEENSKIMVYFPM